MNNISQTILDLQKLHEKTVDKLGILRKEQFDMLVDITLLRILFREDDTLSIDELEMKMFDIQSLYELVKKLDAEILEQENKIEQLESTLHSL
ncbi:MAG: hypothetical protein EAZ95_11660 [Bacteroidetes bacterium]|nr:MAG: hypothetical protein EAZ95_11660 [Bacteroidota bacterium]